jgi:hypothetical protein
MMLAIVFLNVPGASACSCGRIPSAGEALRESSVVFEGTVVDKRVVLGLTDGWVFPVEEYTFAVQRIWKGLPSHQFVLREGFDDCDRRFRGRITYLVFAAHVQNDPKLLGSGKCSPTKPRSEALVDFAALGSPTASFSGSRESPLRLPLTYFLRLHIIAGLAANINVARHPRDAAAWRGGGTTAASGWVIVALLLGACVRVRRRSRVTSVILAGVAFMVIVAAMELSGRQLLRNAFFDSLRVWDQASGVGRFELHSLHVVSDAVGRHSQPDPVLYSTSGETQ